MSTYNHYDNLRSNASLATVAAAARKSANAALHDWNQYRKNLPVGAILRADQSENLNPSNPSHHITHNPINTTMKHLFLSIARLRTERQRRRAMIAALMRHNALEIGSRLNLDPNS